MFVGLGNDLSAALPHASPRLKILMVLHWCCRVTPPPGRVYWGVGGVGILGKLLFSRNWGVKMQRGLGEVQNED